MQITKINLQTGGLKGAHVTHFSPVTKNGRTKVKEIIEKEPHPIHLALETPFKDLRWHLLDLCDVIHDNSHKVDIDELLSDTEVSGIRLDAKINSFVIVGAKRTRKIGKVYNFETPEVTIDDKYEHYETVMKIFERIFEETKLYLSGEVKVTDEEITQRWIESGKLKAVSNLEAYENMPQEEKERIARDILENAGAVVMMPQDVSIEHSDTDINEQLEKNEEKEIVFEKEAEVITMPATK